MVREELFKKFQEVFELSSKKEGKEMVEKLEAMFEDCVLKGEKIPFTLFEVGVKDVKARSGEITKEDGSKLPWTKPAHKEGYVKAKSKLKNMFE